MGTVLGTLEAQQNPAWLGRRFVKVLEQGDPIPGKPGATFGQIIHFTLRDGTIHVIAGESQTTKGLFRWRDGQLTKLVYTDTIAPTGSTFDTVHFTTDETEGALYFVGEVLFGRPGAVYGLFEWKNGAITKVLDTATPVSGKTFLGFGYPVRVGHEVAWSAQYADDTGLKSGIHRWDGTTVQTVIKSGDDLPGSLGGFSGQPGPYQIAFDGQSVAFVATDSANGRGPAGIYRATRDGILNKVVDGNDKLPDGMSYYQSGWTFSNVGVDGAQLFCGVNNLVSAGGGNRFYTSDGVRYSDGTLDPLTGTFGTDGSMEIILPYTEEDGVTRTMLDGRYWRNIEIIDGHGDDVAFTIRLETGKLALYAAVGPVVQPPAAPVLTVPAVVDGHVVLRFSSIAGKNYLVEFKSALSDSAWAPRATLPGTGAEVEYREAVGAAGFYRVTLLP